MPRGIKTQKQKGDLTMKKSILAATLAATILCGTVMADDGNMGAGGYTGCDGSNPPPTCDCNVPNPPATCQGQGGFAAGQYDQTAVEPNYIVAAEVALASVLAAF
jgi:hypothetical protein